jgi:hypothetical protein
MIPLLLASTYTKPLMLGPLDVTVTALEVVWLVGGVFAGVVGVGVVAAGVSVGGVIAGVVGVGVVATGVLVG